MKNPKKWIAPFLMAMFVLVLSAVPAVAASSTVATIGSKNYSSLAKAISAVKDGQTIVLKKSVTYSKSLSISKSGKSFTIDLNKKTITFKSGSYLYLKKGTVTIKNGKIKQKAKTEQYGTVVRVAKNAKLVVKSGTYHGMFTNYGTLSIQNGTFTSYGEIIYNHSSGTVTITKGTFTGSNNVTDGMNLPLLYDEGKMTVKGASCIIQV